MLFTLIISCTENTSRKKTNDSVKISDSSKEKEKSGKKDSIIPANPSKTLKAHPSRRPTQKKPTSVQKFSLKDLTFSWEEINACDCLFMMKAKNTDYERLYFGRFKGDTSGILQFGKNTEKLLIPLTKPRSKNRKPGSFWREIYQNDHYKVQLKANPTQPKVRGKHAYYINFILTDRSTKKVIKNIVLTNCKM